VIGHDCGARTLVATELHHDVASSATNLSEAMGFEDAANLPARENPKASHG
jgi:hypothetical protein